MSEYRVKDGPRPSTGDGGPSSLASLLNLDPKRPLATNLKYDYSSHLASLAHTSNLSHQRNSALSVLAEERAKTAKYRTQSLRLAAGVAVRDNRIQQYNSKLTEIKTILERETIIQAGLDEVLAVCSSGVANLVNTYKASKAALSKASEEKQRLVQQLNLVKDDLQRSGQEKREKEDTIQQLKRDHELIIRQMKESESSLDHLRNERAEKDEMIRHLQDLGHESEKTRDLYQQQQTAIERHILDGNELRTRLEASESHSSKLEIQLQDAQQSKVDIETKLTEATRQLDKFRATESNLQTQITEYEENKIELEQKHATLQDRIRSLEASQQDLITSSNELHIELTDEKSRLVALKKAESSLSTQLEEYKDVVARLEARIGILEEQLQETKSADTTKILEEKLAESTAVLAKVKMVHEAEISRLFKSESALKTALKTVLEENTSLINQVQQLSQQKTSLETKIHGLNMEITKLQETLLDQYALVNSNRSSYVSAQQRKSSSSFDTEGLVRSAAVASSVDDGSARALSPTPSLRRSSGKQISRIASLEGELQTKDERLESLEKQLRDRDNSLSQFGIQVQNLQHHSSQTDKQLKYLNEKVARQSEEKRYWRKTSQEKDLYIIELEGFQRELRAQLFHSQRRKSSRPLLRESSSRMLMSGRQTPVQEEAPASNESESLPSRLMHKRLSSFTPSLLSASINGHTENNQTVKRDYQPLVPSSASSRGNESRLSSAGTRVPTSQGATPTKEHHPTHFPTLQPIKQQNSTDNHISKPSLLQRFARLRHRKDSRLSVGGQT